MRELMHDVEKLVDEELERANEVFPMFASDHEGWAVIFEEVNELKAEYDAVEDALQDLVENVCFDAPAKDSLISARSIEYLALRASCEAIQVAAMAKKFIKSREEKDEENSFEFEIPEFVAKQFRDAVKSGKNTVITTTYRSRFRRKRNESGSVDRESDERSGI